MKNYPAEIEFLKSLSVIKGDASTSVDGLVGAFAVV